MPRCSKPTRDDEAAQRHQRRAASKPYGLSRRRPGSQQEKPKISREAQDKIQIAIQNAWAQPTLKKYGASLEAFLRFCDKENIPDSQRLPAGEVLLCAFAASRAGEIAGSTARDAIAAVKAWHVVHDADWNGGLRLKYTLRGVEHLAPSTSKHDERPPVTAAMLDILERKLDHSDPKDAAVFAAACCAFWGQADLGELLSTAQGSYKQGRIPLGSDLKPPPTRLGSRILRLPYTESKGARGEDAMICRQQGPSDPIRALANHTAINDIEPDLPLFAHRNKRGELVCLTRRKFLDRCNEVWARYGVSTRTGHAFRIGGTTELLLAGVNPDVVQAMGRWKSEAFRVYRETYIDLLAPLHAEYIGV
ncbi:hypothetical protein B0H15DRAFT_1017052 [Mycena belliarum]|uniref:Tyr recombinase domain-containing protein n=1 Tax=Mycena belliarum TaxID=1033014 RepID=A0AAD6Y1M4_9AGAR|nr:hypothetical protein B0H15DRAFT_1017052 [Mycena belliae]